MEKTEGNTSRQKNLKTSKNNSSKVSTPTLVEASLKKFYGSLGRYLSESSQLGSQKAGFKPERICSNHVCPHAPKDMGIRAWLCNELTCPFRRSDK